MFTTEHKHIKKGIVLLIMVPILLSGCLGSKIDEEIEKTPKEEKTKEELKELEEVNIEETEPSDIKLSDEQKEILENQKQVTAEEAVQSNILDTRSEVQTTKPVKKETYSSSDELAQYVSYNFFMYHAGLLKSDDFYTAMSPYFHKDFLELLPESEEDKKNTFTVLQKMFAQQLPAPITEYYVTNTEIDERVNEANFYRKYVLKSGVEIYYQTLLMKDGEHWYLLDDSPTPAYEILPNTKKQLKATIITKKGE